MSDTRDEPHQTVVREVRDLDAGPHFPSGMNTVEAAMSGADRYLSDEEKAKLEEYREVLGEAAPGGAATAKKTRSAAPATAKKE